MILKTLISEILKDPHLLTSVLNNDGPNQVYSVQPNLANVIDHE